MSSPISNDSNRGDSWTPSELELKRRLIRKSQNKKRILIASLSSILVIGTIVIFFVNSPGWQLFTKTYFDFNYGFEILPFVTKGLVTNIRLTIICAISISIFAMLLALARTSKSAALTPFRILAWIKRRYKQCFSAGWTCGHIDLFSLCSRSI